MTNLTNDLRPNKATVSQLSKMYSMSNSTINTLLCRAEFSRYIISERPLTILLNPVTHSLLKNKKKMMYERYK